MHRERRGDAVDFRVLGLLEVVHDGREIELRAAKHRMLVAALALHPNQVIPAERLIEFLWGGAPPASAANTLQGYISNVRRALAGEVIETRPPGYVLAVDADRVDAVRFERLVADGRRALQAGDPAQAGVAFTRALSLWRGPALADFAYEEFAQAEATRLEELRLVTYEHLLEAELAVGNDDAVVGQAGALVEQHPFRERLWAHLLVALYRRARPCARTGGCAGSWPTSLASTLHRSSSASRRRSSATSWRRPRLPCRPRRPAPGFPPPSPTRSRRPCSAGSVS
jgi:DNA-binding SARP family transcriptional activator